MKGDKDLRVLKTSLICCQYVLLTVGFSALSYCGWVLAESTLFQHRAYHELRAGKAESPTGKPLTIDRFAGSRAPLQNAHYAPTLPELSPLGRIEIPRVSISAAVAEGVTARVLKLAVGHIPDTALPGQNGNVGLAGHRDTFFRRLGKLKTGDLIKVTTPEGQFWYAVRFTEIVNPDDTWVLDPSTGQTLTLVTCYPFHFVGPAPRRFVVRARRIESPGDVRSHALQENVMTDAVQTLLKHGE